MTRTAIAKGTKPSRDCMLGIYLNDHLAGATAGGELARRMARSHQRRDEVALLQRLAAEIVQDRTALLDIMAALGITVRAYKVGAAWIGERGRWLTSRRRSSSGVLPAVTAARCCRAGKVFRRVAAAKRGGPGAPG
jgi:hypothetical protein